MNDVLLSVVIPIYKVEQYLTRCVDSVLAQDIGSMELILVDDGSPDGCGAICDRYAEEFPSINVIHKKNGGLSDARNAGIRVARGKYIAFIDSDDYILPGMFSTMCAMMEQYNADISVCGFNDVINDEVYSRREYQNRVYSSADALCAMLYHKDFWVSAWNKIYRKELFHDLAYPVGRLYEDFFLTPRLMDVSRCVCVSDNVFYQYCIRSDSIMGKSAEKISPDLIFNTDDNLKYFSSRKNKYLKNQLNQICAGLICHLYESSRQVFLENEPNKNRDFIIEMKRFVKENIVEIISNPFIAKRVRFVLIASVFSFHTTQKAMMFHAKRSIM